MRCFLALTAFALSLLQGDLAEAVSYVTVNGVRVEVQVAITANIVTDEAADAGKRFGHYVFVASDLAKGAINLGSVERVAICTNVRPRFGHTVPGPSGFTRAAYAVYYGPYASRKEADNVLAAIGSCVPDAYISAGLIERY